MRPFVTATAALLLVLLLVPSPAVRAAGAGLQSPDDVFNQLQRNVWYLPTADHMAQLYVTEVGAGPLVVFLHGGPGNDFHYSIDALRPHLGSHRFILYEQRGSLLSPVADKDIADLTIQQQVADLETLREALGADKLVLFGHSFGTLLALMYYEAHPDRVAGMVLAGAAPPTFGSAGLAGWIKAMRPRQQALLGRKDLIATTETAAGLPADPARDTPRQASIRWRIGQQAALNIIDLGRWKQVTGGGIYYNQKVDDAIGDSLPSRFDIRLTRAAHPVPITVIDGDKDYIDPAGKGWTALAKVGKVVVDVIPDASHYAWIDAPEVFSAALARGLERADARR
ncbi:MAG: alpha/beta fold hydrolase [Rhodanobacteraceae bacterium]